MIFHCLSTSTGVSLVKCVDRFSLLTDGCCVFVPRINRPRKSKGLYLSKSKAFKYFALILNESARIGHMHRLLWCKKRQIAKRQPVIVRIA